MENGAAPLEELLIPACMADAHGNIYSSTVSAVVPQECKECPSKIPDIFERALEQRAADLAQQAANAGTFE